VKKTIHFFQSPSPSSFLDRTRQKSTIGLNPLFRVAQTTFFEFHRQSVK
jgi:hypothetical protein